MGIGPTEKWLVTLLVLAAACRPAPEATAPAPLASTKSHEVRCEPVGQRWGAEHEWMLALTWAPGFCAANPRAAGSDECAHPTAWSRENLGLHGLWPQWSSYCSPGAHADQECRDWPSLPAPSIRDPGVQQRLATMMPGLDTHLDRHEWAKHGTCSGLTADAYFGLAEALDDQVNQLGLGQLLASRAAAAEPTLTAAEVCASVRAKLGEPGAQALQIEAKQGDHGPRYLIGIWFALADGTGPLAIDGAHLRVNPNRICGVGEGGAYFVAR
jgi:ribonuclease T2